VQKRYGVGYRQCALPYDTGFMTVTFLYNFVLTNGIAVMGGAEALIVPAFGLVGGAASLAYARDLNRKGILRQPDAAPRLDRLDIEQTARCLSAVTSLREATL
jgi:hypothetical protein